MRGGFCRRFERRVRRGNFKMNELKTLRQLYTDGLRLRMTAPVDDDFCELMHNFDSTLKAAKETIGTGFDLVAHLHRQREFSLKTFGEGKRTDGVLDHIRKELKEVEDNPSDAEEWIDVILLAMDGLWRAGFDPEQIAKHLEAKQTKNEGRTWPDWKTAEPGKAIEHVSSA